MGYGRARAHWRRTVWLLASVVVGGFTVTSTSPASAGVAANVLITPGQLQFIGGTPGDVGFQGVSLVGTDQSTTGVVNFDISDGTGSGAGWRIEGAGSAFTNTAGRSLPGASAAILTTPVASCDPGSGCVLPVDAISYPYVLPTGTATTLYDASSDSGMGNETVAADFTVSLPATTLAGIYSATWSFTLISGP